MKKYLPIIALILLLCSCSNKKNVENGDFRLVAANFVSYDFSRAICGDKASITLLIKPGTEVHSFDPSPKDIISMEKADLFIYTGGESDEWAEKLLNSMKNQPKKIFKLVENAKVLEEEIVEGMEAEEEEDEESDYEIDEHVWTSPENAITILGALTDTICSLDVKNQDLYRQNAEIYMEKIRQVQSEIKLVIAAKKNHLIVMGDRFPLRYFVDEFGIDYRAAFPGCSSAVEASSATIAYLIDTVKKENLPVVFTIELSNQKIAKTIGDATGATVIELNACHNLTKQQFDAGFTYVDSLKQNKEALEKGLR